MLKTRGEAVIAGFGHHDWIVAVSHSLPPDQLVGRATHE
jgi:hypothetical protein